MIDGLLEFPVIKIDALYEEMVRKWKDEDISKRELQKRKFVDFILPLLNNGNDKQLQWAQGKAIDEAEGFFVKFINDNFGQNIREMSKIMEDLLQEAAECVIKEAKNYDPERSAYTTFLTLHLKGKISKYISGEKYKCKRSYFERIVVLNKAMQKLEQENPGYTDEDLAGATGFTLRVVEKLKQVMTYTHLEYLEANEETENLVTETFNPERELERKERREIINSAFDECLSEIERKVIILRFFSEEVLGEERLLVKKSSPLSYDKIAEALNMTLNQVTYICKKALKKLENNEELQLLLTS